jgi:hypothetical protein
MVAGKVIQCECAAFDDPCELCNFTRGVPSFDGQARMLACMEQSLEGVMSKKRNCKRPLPSA